MVNDWKSVARTEYFEELMERYIQNDDSLPFTPPSSRGSLITNVEAWAISLQRNYVPTLDEAGKWPVINRLDNPDKLSDEQRYWLSNQWGSISQLWKERRNG